MKDEPIPDPPIENLGPAMLALNVRQRRFVVGWLGNGCKNATRVLRASGFNLKDGADRVHAHWLLHNPKVIDGIREEADRRFQGVTAVQAMFKLEKLAESKDEKVRLAANQDILDRTVGKKTTQKIEVEHIDSRSDAELMTELRKLLSPRQTVPALPVIDVEAEPVAADD